VIAALAGALLLAVLVLPLATPARLRLSAGSDPARLRVTLRLLGGHAPAIRVIDTAHPRRKTGPAAATRRRAVDPAARRGTGRRFPPRALLSFLRDLLLRITVRRIDGVLVCGTGDPAETGQIYGALVPLMVLSNGRFQMHPEFDRPVLAARLDLEISAIPVALLPACLRLVRARRGAA